MWPAGISCSKCGSIRFWLEPQEDGSAELRCRTCGCEVVSDIEQARARAYLQRRAGEGPRDGRHDVQQHGSRLSA